MREVTIQGAEILTRKDLHLALKEGLSFPDYYGKNLDALKDCLTDLTEGAKITVVDAEKLEEHLDTYYRSFRRVIRAAQEENEGLIYEEI